jgi:hypothetical protein
MSHDVKYFIDKEKGIVVCKIMDTADDFLVFMAGSNNVLVNSLWKAMVNNPEFQMPREFVGKAQVSAEDVFDEELGKQIAYNRAKHLRDKSFFTHANAFAEWISKESSKVFDDLDRYGRRLTNNENYRTEKITEKLQ